MKFSRSMIKAYQLTISPFFKVFIPHSSCRFYPSCSQYCQEAILTYGTARGVFKAFRRVLRCNPFSKGGVDLV